MSEFLGKTISEYQLIEILDDSGNSIVYKGFQPSMNRYVAFKMLKPEHARDPGKVQRFSAQSELLGRLQHPSLLPVYDSGQIESIVYRVSRFIETGTLRSRMFEFRDPNQALPLLSDVTEALEFIHGQGYIHGNLKPTNIFLDENRRPLLTDFGIQSTPGSPIPAYMAPEQVQGGVVDRRADVYALGVLLYEILVGEAPPPGAVVSPRARRPDIPEAIERVIFKAMAQNPDQRFQSVGEFLSFLQSALTTPAAAPPPSPAVATTPVVSQTVTVAGEKSKTNWMAIILGIILVGILCVGGILVLPGLLEGQPSEPGPEPTQPAINITVEIPTREPKPTKEPVEPEVPPEPTTPPEEKPPESQPTNPPDEGGGIQPPEICSSLGFVGVGLLGGVFMVNRRRKR